MWIRSFFTILFILTGISSAYSADLTVAVMKSDGHLPYEEVLAGFKAEFQNRTLKIIILENGERKSLNAQLSRHQPDIIFCLGTKALEQTSHIKEIPKIFSLITYAGIQPWLNREDVYGVTLDIAPPLQFKAIRQAFPDSKRIAVIYDPKQNQKVITDAKKAAASMGLSLAAYPIDSIKDIPAVFQGLDKNTDLLWSIYDSIVYQPEPAQYILLQCLRRQIPFVGFSPQFARAGALLALYGDYWDMGRQAALQAMAIANQRDNISRIIRPRVVRTAVNKKVAQAMRITYPPSFLINVHLSY
jgi:putative ABC transport system substrate-binding protein